MKIWRKYKFLILIILFAGYYYYPYKIEASGYYHKIWAHRVNSVEKLNSALNYFEGVELDLVYDAKNDVLDVNHPPTKSIGLHFETYLNTIEQNRFPYLWLDIKNLNESNAKRILKKLLTLFNGKNYPLNKVLIESRRVNQLLQFEKKGFKTSFYLPPKLYKKESLDVSNTISEIKTIIKEQPNIAISTDFKDYNILKKEFPKHKKYIWAIVKPIHFNHFKIREILKDTTVKVVLLKYNVVRGN